MNINPFRIVKKFKNKYLQIKNMNDRISSLTDQIHKLEIESYYLRNMSLHESQYPEELSSLYYERTGKHLNLDNPKSFNEKVQWFKLYGCTPEITKLTDKYLVRDFVAERIGEKYLVPLLGVWQYPEEINFSELPDKYIIKANHGCGYNYIVRDKNNVNCEEIIRKAWKWLHEDYSIWTFELQYHGIQRRIIAEQLLENENEESIFDYKFMCFDGNPLFYWIDIDRFGDHRRNIYDMDGNLLKWTLNYRNTNRVIERPKKWQEMVQVVKTLSNGFPQVRVDLYYTNEKIYFGELTFTTESGFGKFTPSEIDYKIGDLWKLQ